jgi:hypothetical protein
MVSGRSEGSGTGRGRGWNKQTIKDKLLWARCTMAE